MEYCAGGSASDIMHACETSLDEEARFAGAESSHQLVVPSVPPLMLLLQHISAPSLHDRSSLTFVRRHWQA